MATLINIGNNIKVNPKFISYFEGSEIVLANKHRFTVTAEVIEQVKGYVENRNTGALHYKGTVASSSQLPSEGNIDGDMFLNQADDKYYAWNGQDWDEVVTIVNISGVHNEVVAETNRATAKEAELEGKVGELEKKVGEVDVFETTANKRFPYAFVVGKTYRFTNKSESGFVTIATNTVATGGTNKTYKSVSAGEFKDITIIEDATYLVIMVSSSISNIIEVADLDSLSAKLDAVNTKIEEIEGSLDVLPNMDARITNLLFATCCWEQGSIQNGQDVVSAKRVRTKNYLYGIKEVNIKDVFDKNIAILGIAYYNLSTGDFEDYVNVASWVSTIGRAGSKARLILFMIDGSDITPNDVKWSDALENGASEQDLEEQVTQNTEDIESIGDEVSEISSVLRMGQITSYLSAVVKYNNEHQDSLGKSVYVNTTKTLTKTNPLRNNYWAVNVYIVKKDIEYEIEIPKTPDTSSCKVFGFSTTLANFNTVGVIEPIDAKTGDGNSAQLAYTPAEDGYLFLSYMSKSTDDTSVYGEPSVSFIEESEENEIERIDKEIEDLKSSFQPSTKHILLNNISYKLRECSPYMLTASHVTSEQYITLSNGQSRIMNPNEWFVKLYDELMSQHQGYVTKTDCLTDAGIPVPSYYTSGKTDLDGTYIQMPFPMYRFKPFCYDDDSLVKVLLLGGTHGEPLGMQSLYEFCKVLCKSDDEDIVGLRNGIDLYVMPLSNPSTFFVSGGRVNWNGVDPNRNMPCEGWVKSGEGTPYYTGESPASEYESKLLIHYVEEILPDIFMDCHNSSAINSPITSKAEYVLWMMKGLCQYTLTSNVGYDVCSRLNEVIQKSDTQNFPQNFGRKLVTLEDIDSRYTQSRAGYMANSQKVISYIIEGVAYKPWKNGTWETDTTPTNNADLVSYEEAAIEDIIKRTIAQIVT